MKAIYASKLYKSKTAAGRANIQSALENPINTELVLQLEEYIGDEYKDLPDLPEKDTKTVKKVEDDVSRSASHRDTIPPTSPHIINSTPREEDIEEDAEDEIDVDSEIVEEEDTSGLNSATNADGPTITAQTVLNTSTTVEGLQLTGLADELKGTLNLREDTCGVIRVALKDNEIWIYYNDNINLNTIMTPVIEILNAASYSYLEFNRLARTDNAIVFTINIIDSQNQVVSVIKDE